MELQKSAPLLPPSSAKNVGGRPEWQPTPTERGQIRHLAKLGLPLHQIAALFHKSPNTLRKRCRQDLIEGGASANQAVLKSLFEMAVDKDHPRVTIFWARARCGFGANWTPSDPGDIYNLLPPSGGDDAENTVGPSPSEWPAESGIVCAVPPEDEPEPAGCPA